MSSIDNTKAPLQVPSNLSQYMKPASEYLTDTSSETTDGVYVSGIIFATETTSSLIHRYKHYVLLVESGEDGHWDVPGGPCDSKDPSILHSCTRNLREATGLHALGISMALGSYKTSDGRLRIDFVVQVDEVPNRPLDVKHLGVQLDTSRYRTHAWATEEEVKDGQFNLTSNGLKDAILAGFADRSERKHDREGRLWSAGLFRS